MGRQMARVAQLQRSNSKTVLVLALSALVWWAGISFGVEPKKVEVSPKYNVGDFTYSTDNRRDPFEPVYLARIKQSKTGSSLKRGYELEELKLVGILKTDKNRFAMMEDMQGKGIMFKKGDFLNNNLWVADVLEGKIVLAYKLKGEMKNINIDISKK
jgi:hypothetical protein